MPILAAMALAAIAGSGAAAATPPDGGSISIEPRTADGDYDPSTRSFVEATGEALAARGFTILEDPGHAAYVAELTLSRVEVGTGLAKPASAGATPTGVFGGVGAGVSIPLSTGRSELVPLRRTRLELRIRKQGEAGALWQGTAVTVRAGGTRTGADAAVAEALTGALLRSYPAEPADVVGVP